MLSVCCFTSVYGRLCGIYGRRNTLLIALTFFSVFSGSEIRRQKLIRMYVSCGKSVMRDCAEYEPVDRGEGIGRCGWGRFIGR